MPMLLSHIIWFFVDYNLYLILFWNTALNRPGFVRRDIEKGKKSHDHIYLDKIQNSTSMFHENTFQSSNFPFIHFSPLTFMFIQLRFSLNFYYMLWLIFFKFFKLKKFN